VAAIGLVGMKIYGVWHEQTPIPGTGDVIPATAPTHTVLSHGRTAPAVSTTTIIARNLFDPDRGAKAETPPAPQKVEEPDQSIEGLLLLGTVVAGPERYAIMQVPPDIGRDSRNRRIMERTPARRPAASASGELRRVRVGDSLRGYEVKDIQEQKVVLARGSSQTELTIDYTREVAAPNKPTVKRPPRRFREQSARSRRIRERRTP
jgi:hypothetical protein